MVVTLLMPLLLSITITQNNNNSTVEETEEGTHTAVFVITRLSQTESSMGMMEIVHYNGSYTQKHSITT